MKASVELLWHCGTAPVLLAGAVECPGLQQTLAARLLAKLFSGQQYFRLGHNGLGRPLAFASSGQPLQVGLSFSRYAGWLWTAASLTPELGIDVTGPEDFADPYPERRVYAPGELDAGQQYSSSIFEARALLWSLKEAAAKALGTGFHRVEPLELEVENLRQADKHFLACQITSPQGSLNALAGCANGMRVAVATRIHQARSHHG